MGALPDSEGLASLHPVRPLPNLDELKPGAIPTGPPIFEDVDPASLLIEERYQRDLSDRSIALIERIIQNWDWRRFKPPVVAFADGGLQIIDGQHTAIAAASHPDIDLIPVMIVDAPALADRALAFVGHNRDRLQVTAMQLHHAAVAAGDEDALTLEQVCLRAGVNLVRSCYGGYDWKVGDTVAIGAIRSLISKHTPMRARRVLQALVAADRAPVSAPEIKAAELLLTGSEYVERLGGLEEGATELASVIRRLGANAARDAKVFSTAQCVPFWKALAITWFKACKKKALVG
ncbi:MAG: hypothetical protein EBS42_13675 [Caulobacteraceae bacterium]|nr:hypothetical protein [Caulobacteraceae bacterium]